MVVLYKTANKPIVFKARPLSLATIFRGLCILLKYGAPILICFFFVNYSPGYTSDPEFPVVIPGKINSFIINTNNETVSFVYPPDPNQESRPMLMRTYLDKNGDELKEWSISLKIPNVNEISIISITILFNFTVMLRKWANNTIDVVGSFTRSFPSQINYVSCVGDLVLEQSEIIDFRGSFEHATLEYPSYATYSQILETEDNLSTLFYVDWEEPIVKYGNWPEFDLNLRIRVRELEIWHSIPLVSSIESVLILYLSTLIFTSLILDTAQGFIFRNGIIKSWAIPLFQKKKKQHGNVRHRN
ncbi:hypothetical protein TRFO_01660 [Tritrichomonas foetus]|uniref:Transmembrane protein 231 n=1 Tax=Tritrichomonas foetus TaxID=1144522 RepID=A0A1J4JU89_9EUKA|nr:hypothetical protein TRFO_01660 [Tritrichomonas foetus]|eukprot:OHT01086.1 hypothetical protein TRFO_01660 [Tritrichomonas foetus]